jgi:hypothetical protein
MFHEQETIVVTGVMATIVLRYFALVAAKLAKLQVICYRHAMVHEYPVQEP